MQYGQEGKARVGDLQGAEVVPGAAPSPWIWAEQDVSCPWVSQYFLHTERGLALGSCTGGSTSR